MEFLFVISTLPFVGSFDIYTLHKFITIAMSILHKCAFEAGHTYPSHGLSVYGTKRYCGQPAKQTPKSDLGLSDYHRYMPFCRPRSVPNNTWCWYFFRVPLRIAFQTTRFNTPRCGVLIEPGFLKRETNIRKTSEFIAGKAEDQNGRRRCYSSSRTHLRAFPIAFLYGLRFKSPAFWITNGIAALAGLFLLFVSHR